MVFYFSRPRPIQVVQSLWSLSVSLCLYRPLFWTAVLGFRDQTFRKIRSSIFPMTTEHSRPTSPSFYIYRQYFDYALVKQLTAHLQVRFRMSTPIARSTHPGRCSPVKNSTVTRLNKPTPGMTMECLCDLPYSSPLPFLFCSVCPGLESTQQHNIPEQSLGPLIGAHRVLELFHETAAHGQLRCDNLRHYSGRYRHAACVHWA